MPRRPRAGLEGDSCYLQPRGRFTGDDWIKPYCSTEPVGWALPCAARFFLENLHELKLQQFSDDTDCLRTSFYTRSLA